MSTDALEILRAHFGAQRRKRLTVPGGVLELWASPMTLADHAEMAKHIGNAAVFCAELLMRKATDAKGNPVFSGPLARASLINGVQADVLNDLANQILDGGPGPAELGESSAGPSAPPSAPSTASPPSADAPPPTSSTP